MPFIGNKPSAVPLTSADIADGIITSAKIADGTIVNADINASSAIAISKISATGTSLQSLRMNSGATALEFATLSTGFTLGTPVTVSGTSVTFSGIPANVKMLIINFNEISSVDNNNLLIQIGDSGGIETSGYNSQTVKINQDASLSHEYSTSGFNMMFENTTHKFTGQYFINLTNSSNNTFVGSGNAKIGSSGNIVANVLGSGAKSLSDVLTQVKISFNAGSSFDAGEINIMYI